MSRIAKLHIIVDKRWQADLRSIQHGYAETRRSELPEDA